VVSIRSVAAGFFLVLGALLTIPASVAVWQERTILDEDTFVKTAGAVLDEEDVQVAVASRMADAVMVQLDIRNRIDAAIVGLERSRRPDSTPRLYLGGRLFHCPSDLSSLSAYCQSDVSADARDLISESFWGVHGAYTKRLTFLIATRGGVVMDLRPQSTRLSMK
jgi:hypothetical protein